jgi:tRNA A37 threonylcarbamoyladenosine synthetase subunit TsaC/SUA5/YrdC
VEALGHALVVTSVHDEDEMLEHTPDPELIEERIGHQVELVIDGGMGGMEGSTVIDLTGEGPVVLREGKGAVDDIF